jgi:hypothetical protein
MIVTVDLSVAPPRIALVEPDEFGSFKVLVTGGDRVDSLASAIVRVGRLAEDADHAYISVSAVEALADGRAPDEHWLALLRAMLDAARRHGWVASDGAIRAHVEWEG